MKLYNEEYHAIMAKKLGLKKPDETLTTKLFKTMEKCSTDFTNTFRLIAQVKS